MSWLVKRRLTQLFVMGIFVFSDAIGIWFIKGDITSSLVMGLIPLTDPFYFLQAALASGLSLATPAIIGAVIVTVIYLVIGGRTFCGWVCPVNIIADLAAWLRVMLKIKGGLKPTKHTRFIILIAVLFGALVSGKILWEIINPVSSIHRGIVFGLTASMTFAITILITDTLIGSRLWCGRLCPMGAFYSLLNHHKQIMVGTSNKSACTDCGDCFNACPEPQVISPALKGVDLTIKDSQCTNCMRCIDVCDEDVFSVISFANVNTKQVSEEQGAKTK